MLQAGGVVRCGLLWLLCAVLCGPAIAQTYAIAEKFHADIVRVMQDAIVKAKFADLGVEAVSSTPQQFTSFIKAEMDKYARLIKEAGIKAQ
jgi:tripartite-type tricarboxylate transporter receptor subunit TctC